MVRRKESHRWSAQERGCECRACGRVLAGERLQDALCKTPALAYRAKGRKRVGVTHEIFDRSLEDALLDSGKDDLELFRITVEVRTRLAIYRRESDSTRESPRTWRR